jgi:ubiquinone/menaquinone biosynthesis C-methylase UbiE
LLHQVGDKQAVIRQAYRVLKTGGELLAVEWKNDATIGPPKEERVSKEEVGELLEEFGLRPVKELRSGSFHYALLYKK